MKTIIFVGSLLAGIFAQATTCSFYTDSQKGRAIVTVNGRSESCRLISAGGIFNTHKYRCPSGKIFIWVIRGGRIKVDNREVYCDYLGETLSLQR